MHTCMCIQIVDGARKLTNTLQGTINLTHYMVNSQFQYHSIFVTCLWFPLIYESKFLNVSPAMAFWLVVQPALWKIRKSVQLRMTIQKKWETTFMFQTTTQIISWTSGNNSRIWITAAHGNQFPYWPWFQMGLFHVAKQQMVQTTNQCSTTIPKT